MRYLLGATLLASLMAAGSASAHHVHHKKVYLDRSMGDHRLYNFSGSTPFHPAAPDPNDPYETGRAAVGGL